MLVISRSLFVSRNHWDFLDWVRLWVKCSFPLPRNIHFPSSTNINYCEYWHTVISQVSNYFSANSFWNQEPPISIIKEIHIIHKDSLHEAIQGRWSSHWNNGIDRMYLQSRIQEKNKELERRAREPNSIISIGEILSLKQRLVMHLN